MTTKVTHAIGTISHAVENHNICVHYSCSMDDAEFRFRIDSLDNVKVDAESRSNSYKSYSLGSYDVPYIIDKVVPFIETLEPFHFDPDSILSAVGFMFSYDGEGYGVIVPKDSDEYSFWRGQDASILYPYEFSPNWCIDDWDDNVYDLVKNDNYLPNCFVHIPADYHGTRKNELASYCSSIYFDVKENKFDHQDKLLPEAERVFQDLVVDALNTHTMIDSRKLAMFLDPLNAPKELC